MTAGAPAILASAGEWVLSVVTVAGMLAVAYVAWKVVNRSEAGDAAFQAKLKADDERAKRGLREQSGLPPV